MSNLWNGSLLPVNSVISSSYDVFRYKVTSGYYTKVCRCMISCGFITRTKFCFVFRKSSRSRALHRKRVWSMPANDDRVDELTASRNWHIKGTFTVCIKTILLLCQKDVSLLGAQKILIFRQLRQQRYLIIKNRCNRCHAPILQVWALAIVLCNTNWINNLTFFHKSSRV